MKKLKLFFALFAMLALGVGNAWGATITINGSASGITTTDGNQTITVDGITFKGKFKQYSTTALWFTSGSGYIYNTTSLGTINSITINYKSGGSGSSKQYFTSGTSEITSYQDGTAQITTSTGGTAGTHSSFSGGFFNISISNKNLQATSIVIDYTPAGGGETPGEGGGEDPVDPTPETGGSGTIVIKYNSTFAPALPTAKASVNTTSTAHLVEGLGIKEQSIYKGSSNNYLMFVENKGFLYNTQSLGTITSVSVTYTSGTSTSGKAGVYFGSTEQSTYTTTSNQTIKGQSQTDTWTNTTEGNGFFQLSTSNKNVQITQIEITYTSGSEGGGGEEPVDSLTAK